MIRMCETDEKLRMTHDGQTVVSAMFEKMTFSSDIFIQKQTNQFSSQTNKQTIKIKVIFKDKESTIKINLSLVGQLLNNLSLSFISIEVGCLTEFLKTKG